MSLDFLANIPGYEDLPIAQPPPGVVSDFVHPENRAYQVYIMSGVNLSLLLTVAAIRLYVKRRILKVRTKDDIPYFIGVAMAITYIAMVIILLHGGGFGMHAWNVQLKVFTVDQLRLSLALQGLYCPMVWLVKLPLFLMYIEVFGRLKWLKYMAWSVLISTGILLLVAMVTVSVWCSPTTGFGQLDYASAISSASCRSQSLTLCYIQGAITIATDVFLLVLPMPAIWSLKLSTHRKIGLSALILTGVLGVVCSCLATMYRILQLNSGEGFNSDITWYTVPLWIVMISEMTCALIISAAPSLLVFSKKVVGPFVSKLATSRFTFRSSASRPSIAKIGESDSSRAELGSGTSGKIWRTKEFSVHQTYNSDLHSEEGDA